MKKIDALTLYLNANREERELPDGDLYLKQSEYDEDAFVVNPHQTRHGSSPAEVINTADALRAKLITVFGEKARLWKTSDLRLAEFDYEERSKSLSALKRDLRESEARLPILKLEQFGRQFGKVREFRLTKDILIMSQQRVGAKRKLRLSYERPVRKYPRRDSDPIPTKTFKEVFAIPMFRQHDYDRYKDLVERVDTLSDRVSLSQHIVDKIPSYRVLEPVIKATFDWDRLGNKHDNETAHAYQYIVNALYHIRKGDTDYAKLLGQAFDGEAIEEYRKESATDDGEYMVLTDTEADAKVAEYIKDSLWAFSADWLIENGFVAIPKAELQSMQERMCEGCNEIMLGLVGDKLDQLVEDAVKADGRGHFLSGYDGKEIVLECAINHGGGFYGYRTN